MNFNEVFRRRKPIIGMIHLAGPKEEKVARALEELRIYEGEGLDGAIIEDYHGSVNDVINTLSQARQLKIVKGVNILRDPYLGLNLARDFEASFVQFDTVVGKNIDSNSYYGMVKDYPEICILGGVRFKYQEPTGRSLEKDIADGIERCDAIVTTGEGTGIETPLQKLKDFRRVAGDFPLIVGAGVNAKNIQEQLEICNGAIIGSYLKGGDTTKKSDKYLVREIRRLADKCQ